MKSGAGLISLFPATAVTGHRAAGGDGPTARVHDRLPVRGRGGGGGSRPDGGAVKRCDEHV